MLPELYFQQLYSNEEARERAKAELKNNPNSKLSQKIIQQKQEFIQEQLAAFFTKQFFNQMFKDEKKREAAEKELLNNPEGELAQKHAIFIQGAMANLPMIELAYIAYENINFTHDIIQSWYGKSIEDIKQELKLQVTAKVIIDGETIEETKKPFELDLSPLLNDFREKVKAQKLAQMTKKSKKTSDN